MKDSTHNSQIYESNSTIYGHNNKIYGNYNTIHGHNNSDYGIGNKFYGHNNKRKMNGNVSSSPDTEKSCIEKDLSNFNLDNVSINACIVSPGASVKGATFSNTECYGVTISNTKKISSTSKTNKTSFVSSSSSTSTTHHNEKDERISFLIKNLSDENREIAEYFMEEIQNLKSKNN